MLPQSHFIAFNDIKSKQFSNTLRDSTAFTFNSCIRQPVAQELDKIHMLYARKFCRLISGVGVLEQACCSASIERVLWCISEACKYKKRNCNGGHDAFLPGAELGGCQGGPLPPQNFAWPPSGPPKIRSLSVGLFLKVLHRPLTAPLVAKLVPPVAPPNENVWLRPWFLLNCNIGC